LGHNGKENPIGIETKMYDPQQRTGRCHNGKENPIGIETLQESIKKFGWTNVTMEKKTR